MMPVLAREVSRSVLTEPRNDSGRLVEPTVMRATIRRHQFLDRDAQFLRKFRRDGIRNDSFATFDGANNFGSDTHGSGELHLSETFEYAPVSRVAGVDGHQYDIGNLDAEYDGHLRQQIHTRRDLTVLPAPNRRTTHTCTASKCGAADFSGLTSLLQGSRREPAHHSTAHQAARVFVFIARHCAAFPVGFANVDIFRWLYLDAPLALSKNYTGDGEHGREVVTI